MLRVLFFTLILFSSVAFAQSIEKKDAYTFFEYQKIGDKLLAEKFKSFCKEVDKIHGLGLIISYGTQAQNSLRLTKINRNIPWLGACHETSIRLVSAKSSKRPTTVFWIVPQNAEMPEPISEINLMSLSIYKTSVIKQNLMSLRKNKKSRWLSKLCSCCRSTISKKN